MSKSRECFWCGRPAIHVVVTTGHEGPAPNEERHPVCPGCLVMVKEAAEDGTYCPCAPPVKLTVEELPSDALEK